MRYSFTFFFILLNYFSFSQSNYNIIPKPLKLIEHDGSFKITKKTFIVLVDDDSLTRKIIENFSQQIQSCSGIKLQIKKYSSSINLSVNAIVFKNADKKEIGDEGYYIQASSNQVFVEANSSNGFFYATQTLLQLLPARIFGTEMVKEKIEWTIPCCEIMDVPRYAYRGMHLDVGRHFFPVSFIKKYIDLIAMHKMNTFHWHLTEDQGWRIEIKKYPLLTEVGSKRKESMTGAYDENKFDATPYGGFYTQDEIREVVKYAQEKCVTIIPEIEMPGHSKAALAAYPELACTAGPFEVATQWGVFEEVYCPTEKTFQFIEEVLTEVINLFPGKYIHIGGDECPKASWKKSEYCQSLMKQEGLKDEMQLQSYFIRRIEKFLNSKGKKLIGWDEILEGGLAPEATVMSWRGTDGGIAAARQNHDVIMTPGSHCYFDHYQSDPATEPLAIGGYTTLKKVYSYEPTPADSLTPSQQKHIMGAQGNVWTEYITDSKQVEYMAYPRACALAEVLWSAKENNNWDDFSNRLQYHFKRMDALGVNYSKSIFDVTATSTADTLTNQINISLDKFISAGQIYFTTDGTEPTANSKLYSQPFPVTATSMVKACLFNGNEKGKVLTKNIVVHKATAKPYLLANAWKQYDGGTLFGLTDGVTGILNRYNTWVGFSGKDLEATIDLKEETSLHKISINFYNKNRSWIFAPTVAEFFISDDGKTFHSVYKTEVAKDSSANSIISVTAVFNYNVQARYVKVFAKNTGKCPEGSECAGYDAWLFADEVVVE